MATLIEQRPRKPLELIDGGHISARIKTKWAPSDTPGWSKSVGDQFVLVLDGPMIAEGKRYELALDEIEMNRIVIEWLTHQQQIRVQRDRERASAQVV